MKKILFVTVTLITCAFPALGQAFPSRPGPYVSGFIGATVPVDKNVTSNDFLTGASFTDRVDFDTGVDVGGTAGYDFGLFRLEGELSYKYSKIKSITDTADNFQFLSPDGDLGVFAMMFNGFFNLPNYTPITPYWGGGLGFANLHLSDTRGIDTRGGTPQQALLYGRGDDTVFAYQAGAGLEIALDRRLSLDLGYRYFGTARARFDSGIGTDTSMRYESHNAVAAIRVKF